MLKFIDNFLNAITMYRLILYSLIVLSIIAIVFSLFGILSFSPVAMIATIVVLFLVCNLINYVISKIFTIPINYESATITSLILFLILAPVASSTDAVHVVLAGLLAMLSKYILKVGKKHIFNPAAISAVTLGVMGSGIVTWWVGSVELLPIVSIVGFLILRKVRKFSLFLAFLISAIASIVAFNFPGVNGVPTLVIEVFKSWPIVFFGTVMLTEPLTMPPRKNLQMIYGVIVGIIFGSNYAFGPIYSTPEMALVLGNVFAFIVSPKARLTLKLKEKTQNGGGIVDFIFDKPKNFSFTPGQYMEWTLPHRGIDSRGNRRFFTLASSPTEDTIRLGVRIYEKSSSFKRALNELPDKSKIAAGQLAGDFVLPHDSTKKLVFIAGGIGITPFRSIVKYLLDKKEKRDIVLLHILKTPKDEVYRDVFDAAAKIMGMKIIYVISEEQSAPKGWRGRVGHLTPDMITQETPDYKDRRFYLSGSHAMVSAGQDVLSKIGISKNDIVVDYFPGFV